MNISPSSLSLNIANIQSLALNSLLGSSTDFYNDFLRADTSAFPSSKNSTLDPLLLLSKYSETASVPALGRNLALNDPESAYKMMTLINNRDVSYKAQFSELSQMQSYVAKMQDAGQNLGDIQATNSNEQIKSQLISFTEQYNNWVQRFDNDMQSGGLLAGTQAAQVAVHELEQSIKYLFNGAKDGLYGLSDIGIQIDPNTKLATLNATQLDSVLASNRQGVINTIQEFSANFTKSAYLLNSDNNFIPNQLNNLNKAIHFIADNKESLQVEFGTGNPAKPTGQVAQALAAYNQTFGV